MYSCVIDMFKMSLIDYDKGVKDSEELLVLNMIKVFTKSEYAFDCAYLSQETYNSSFLERSYERIKDADDLETIRNIILDTIYEAEDTIEKIEKYVILTENVYKIFMMWDPPSSQRDFYETCMKKQEELKTIINLNDEPSQTLLNISCLAHNMTSFKYKTIDKSIQGKIYDEIEKKMAFMVESAEDSVRVNQYANNLRRLHETLDKYEDLGYIRKTFYCEMKLKFQKISSYVSYHIP